MTTTYNFTEIKSTEKALLVSIEGIEMWLPKSVCAINGDTIEVAEWKAREINGKIANRAKLVKETEALRKQVEKSHAEWLATATEEQKKEREMVDAHCATYCHYDSRRREYYAIDVNGKRHNA